MKRGGSVISVKLADGSVRTARVMLGWRPLSPPYQGLRLEWCVAIAEGNTLLVAVRPRGATLALGALAPDTNLLTAEHARAAVETHGGPAKLTDDVPLGWQLAGLGFLREDDVTAFLSQQYRVPTIDLDAYEIAPEVLALVSFELCTRHCVLPVSRAGPSLIVAMVDPNDGQARDALAAATGFTIEPVIASSDAVRSAITRYYG